jgi:putative transposase
MMRNRRSIRLKGYDYRSCGAYFITICTHERVCLFGDIVNGRMHLNRAGGIVHQHIHTLPRHFPRLAVDASIVMPNHVHFVLLLHDAGRGEASVHLRTSSRSNRELPPEAVRPVPADASPLPSPQNIRPAGTVPGSVGAIVQNLKSVTTRRINRMTGMPGNRIWQRNYWDRIIRNPSEFERVRQYILENPLRWEKDGLHP